MEDSLAVTADLRPIIKWEQTFLVLAWTDLTYKALGQAQDARDNVSLKGLKYALQVADQHPGVDIDQVTEAEHLGTVHKVLSVLQQREKPLLSRYPADHQVFLHSQQLLPQFDDSSQLRNDCSQGRVQLLKTDQRLPTHETEVGEGPLGHLLEAKVPVVDDPGGGGGQASPVTSRAVVTPSVVTEAGTGEASKLNFALQTGELLLGETHLRADGKDDQAVPEPRQLLRFQRVKKGSDTPPAYLRYTLGMKKVGAKLAGIHLGNQVPQRAPTFTAEENPSGGVYIVTWNDDVTQTLLLSW